MRTLTCIEIVEQAEEILSILCRIYDDHEDKVSMRFDHAVYDEDGSAVAMKIVYTFQKYFIPFHLLEPSVVRFSNVDLDNIWMYECKLCLTFIFYFEVS